MWRALNSLTFATSAAALSLPSLGAKSSADDVLSTFKSDLPAYVKRGGTAVVTGGNSGIGLESVRVLLEAGCKVVLCSRSVESGRAALESVGASGCRVQQLDLADLDSVSAAVAEIVQTEGEPKDSN